MLQLNSVHFADSEVKIPEDYCGHIYIITSKTSRKSYVGQALSHSLRNRSYKPHGYLGRWKAHLQEAHGSKKKTCAALNGAILLYGDDDFDVKLIDTCTPEPENISDHEIYYISKYNTIAPNGYNIHHGGFYTKTTDIQRKNQSDKLKEHYSNTGNLKKFSNIISTKRDSIKYEKYLNDDKIIHCRVKYYKWVDRENIRIMVAFKESKDEKIEFRKSGTGSTDELFNRTAKYIREIFKNKMVYFDNDEFYTYFQNNN